MKKLITFCLLVLTAIQSQAASYAQVRAEVEKSPGIQTEIVKLSPATINKLIEVQLESEKNNPPIFKPLHIRPISPGITFYHLPLWIADYNTDSPKITLRKQQLDEWATGEILDMVINNVPDGEFGVDLVCAVSRDQGYEFQVCGKGSFNRYGFTPSKVTAE